MHYSGDMKPIVLASGTEINTSTEVVFSNGIEANIARLVKPILYVKMATGTITTGSVAVTYACRIADIPAVTSTTATVNVLISAVGDYYWGLLPITSDYSTLRVTKVKNNMDQDATSYEVGLTGMIIY